MSVRVASIACCDALRVATLSPLAAAAATIAAAVAAKLAGSSPAIRRLNSAASAGYAARYAAKRSDQACSSLGTAGAGVPSGEYVLGDHERRIRPAQRGARRRDFFLT